MPAPKKDVQPASLSSPTQTAETQPATLYETNITSSPWHSCSTEGDGTVTQSLDPHWHNNQTVVVLAQETWMSTSKGVYIGISVTILALLVMFVVFWIKRTGVTAYRRVTGVAGQSVTLPCYYNGEVTSMCWGRGSCPWFDCGTNIIWTDGFRVTYRRDGRYQLYGDIPGRDVSLTINNAAVSDTGLYCCRIEVEKLSLHYVQITLRSKKHDQIQVAALAQETWMSTSKGVYIGISVTILALLVMFVVFWIRRRYFCLGNKVELLRVIPLKDSRIGALKNAALKPIQAEDNVYIIDDYH
ncbi:hypothetical protein MG293_008152 [Ovis ammon polii]|uniref:Ig-like domain-containing protein n=1 Tax=Ovis ammon polii TaxID=230172 RepID=A0AAD4UCG6_OVIAM|nr:hypothetical protein MG293_008152 [Ovis ammon polii]